MASPTLHGAPAGERAEIARKRETRIPRFSSHAGFWAVAVSMAVITAFSTAPSPLYGQFRQEDGLSSLTITVVYAVYAAGIVLSLLLVGHVSDWYGRRPVFIPALATALSASVVFSFSTSLPALFVGRVLTGLALGAAIATATAYLTDLDRHAVGGATRRSQITGTVANIGGLAVGPLLAGLLGRYVGGEPRLTWMVFDALLIVALVLTLVAPEVRPLPTPRPAYHPQRLATPPNARIQFRAALLGVFLCFTVFGIFAGLATAFLAGPLRHPSPALAGLAVFLSFGIGATTQVVTLTWPVPRMVKMGVPVLIAGLAVLVTSAWLPTPNLALFLIGAGVVGIGAGSLFRATQAVVVSTAPAGDIAGALASYFVAGYVGISLPVVGAGILLEHITLKSILLIFSAVIAAGILLASPALLRLRARTAGATSQSKTP